MNPPASSNHGHATPRSNFNFLRYIWPKAHEECLKVERFVDADPVISCFYARKVVERVVHHIWAFRSLGPTERRSLLDLMKDRAFYEEVRSTTIMEKLHILRKNGNNAAHADDLQGRLTPATSDKARHTAGHLYDVMVWAARHHSAYPELAPGPQAGFDPSLLGQASADTTGLHLPGRTQAETARYLKELEKKDQQYKQQKLLLDEAQQKMRDAEAQRLREKAKFELQRRNAQMQAQSQLADAEARAEAERVAKEEVERELAAQIEQLQAELAKQQASKSVDTGRPTAPLAISEVETRRQLIDPMLADAGFTGDSITRELKLTGMPTPSGMGYADYVLWDDDRTPLAVIEAKKAMESMSAGAQQVKLYADCIERAYGQRPVMFCTNGFQIDIIDDAANLPGSGAGYPAREVEGFPNAPQLRRMIARRNTRSSLANMEVDPEIAGAGGRVYQLEAIRALTETLEQQRHRQALLVMATGTGKTRVAVATAKLLRNAGWVGKVLFLADRTALVNQAHKAFLNLYPQSSPVNLLENPDQVGDVYISTHHTIMNLINDDGANSARFNPFDFDLIIVDEAHRSVYNHFGRILNYFDAYVLGLTATPKSDINHDTYALFGVDDNTPTYEYSLDEAIKDGNLVPFKTLKQESKFMHRGVKYDQLSPEEQVAWDMAEWGTDEDGSRLNPPDKVSSADINRYLYNRDTIRQVLKTVVEHAIRVGGDQLGKTIIFARSQKHAELIKEVFDAAFPEYSLKGASVITNHTRYPQSALNEFSQPNGPVNVAISVDMLDTGVDVPEVVNLVFFKPVYSPSKFWQMVGRGTRLCPNLFGPDRDKQNFLIFDFCDNIDQFFLGSATEVSVQRPHSLSEKLFTHRAYLLGQLDSHQVSPEFRTRLADELYTATASIPLDNIMVRPEDKETLLRFSTREEWNSLEERDVQNLVNHIAHLPLLTMKDSESAKRFDLLVLQLQADLLNSSPKFHTLREAVEKMADDLMAVSTNIPAVAQHRSFMERVLNVDWWAHVTVEDLEEIRLGLRDLIQFIPKSKRSPVILDIADEMGELSVEEFTPHAAVTTVSYMTSVEQRLRDLLEEHSNNVAMMKLRTARPLTATDVATLESIVAEADGGEPGYSEGIEELRQRLGGDSIPAFIRRLVGLDKTAMLEEFQDLLNNSTLTAAQIRFIKTLVDVLVHNGGVTYEEIFQAPFDEEGSVIDIFDGRTGVIVELREHLEKIERSAKAE
ncbi:DEAD/DEAH box helicase [Corynebacterium sp. 320]|uniref:DEAD/DEAH box helicase family protein n=1 Tax=Corynebacterium TaxID=1716 RepID=UPI00125CD0BF|nr:MULTISPECIES: DEAD/DEAH box helicase family protein [Corynebacterium]KAB1501319.1 DEAD/DEAH box helicase [Corynebacterium sp. 320]KAB1551488.1 DEAD/DEAH box helicase [Corynebacterium sp. 321]KAB1551684.1 DEAD/DEAH box helicase [Corynebacterium sp. 319]KAB3525684.1 DEAD/DEAH box helicase [Corynebacterium sp. 250]KAB3538674.1 DEAD/DEAH box helicase [Corynebacterium sp. 366]